ncbi:FHA domain-containing protein [Pseudonocardia abyssalis]|uniref:ATP-binding cassette domain-containing protein n=1 Tax=Pseudonocardia abyssalis TaxID=2792008 RepID=A0ABS6UV62_9PSEU|nr:ATP-binding cassette domain-containing protein [Pseudonocardia abyssalis]MBW0114991.1 ATP-binding cassette domain-containing protein [Pseudonocardia abyssalis]MBW0136131.1 ATP-binding cassette domain-containing protein [Pseudonocardia abyssalis]
MQSLELVAEGRRVQVPAGRPFVIGRGPTADLDLPGEHVSRTHLVVELTDGRWTLTDHSRYGTYSEGRRVTTLALNGPTVVHLGSPPTVTALEFRPVGAPARRAPEPTRLPGPAPVPAGGVLARQGGGATMSYSVAGAPAARITVGRLPDNDVVLDDLLVSRHHAELRRVGPGWLITDLGTGNGTFVNGMRVQRAQVGPRDVIGIGHALLQMQGDELVAAVDTGDVAFEVRDISVVTDKGKTLLSNVGFGLAGKSLLAVVGPSGAGKSTLLRALTGSRPADVGEVRYAGRDLYAEYDELRHRIGLVPQDDVLHPQLTVIRALRYAARLRFPADVPRADRERRITEVLHELGLTNQAKQRIDTLSGGQRKRTSVALELLTKPTLLFLDEPTSGLDPGLDKSVMQTLRGLADDGRTVVVVTHSVANLDQCDRLLVLAPGGHVAYFGPPQEALEYFGQPDFAEMFLLLGRVPGDQLGMRFRQSMQHRRYVAGATGHTPRVESRSAPSVAPPQQRFGTQLSVLCRRYLSVIASDKQYAISLAVLPLFLALIARLVPGDSGLSVAAAFAARDLQPLQLLLVLVVGGALVGLAAAIRELVKERPVFIRERAIGLSLGAYLTSKLLVLGVITGLQAVVFTLLALIGRDLPDEAVLLGSPIAEVLLAVVGVTVVTMALGLAISAWIDNADRGMPLLVLVLMLELVVSGGIFPVHDRPVLEQLAWLVPSRWAFAMGSSTVDMNALLADPDPLWEHTSQQWLLAAGALVAIMVVLVVLTSVLLRRLDPVRAKR